jgi:bifunctional non-homologous end joining protein LigD
MAKLKTYRSKRDFGKTSEPRGKTPSTRSSRKKGFQYVIQKHDATRLHYDLRLELDGVMLSWAVTRGPSLVPAEKRLAIHVEDHPIEYNKFEGTIPKGEYGGGTVMIWDRGAWTPEHDPQKGMKKGHLDFELDGEKLKGRWHLVRMRKRPGERQEPWLLIKSDDEYARKKSDPDILEEREESAATGRSMDEIAGAKKGKVWHSKPRATPTRFEKAAAKLGLKPKGAATKARTKTSVKLRATKTKARKPRAAAFHAKSVTRKGKAKVPDFIQPCLATLSTAIPNGGDWVHEIKFDGYRMQARLDGGGITLKTRTGLDWTHKFPSIAERLKSLARHDALIDGEIVSGEQVGASDFSALQDDLKTGRHDRMAYYVFDLLHLDGADLTGAPLIERKKELQRLLAKLPKDSVVRYSEHFESEGPAMLQHACDLNLEGVISKRRDAPYHGGRNGDWLKTKCSTSQELIIAGFGPSDVAPKRVRALVLGYYDKVGLQYAGRVGTGFSDKMRDDFWRKLAPLQIDKCPFGKVPEEERGRPVRWVKPQIVIEVDFRGWTGGGRVRQASFKGIREDKPASQVVREISRMPSKKPARKKKAMPAKTGTSKAKAVSKSKVTAAEVAGVSLTHPDRVYWDDVDVTKQVLAEYYERVWKHMAPHVTGRVLALVRCPDGQTGQCFYQKHASAGFERAKLHLVSEPDGEESISVDDLAGVVALVQAGVLEIHVRGSTVERLEEADRLVFDLDPGPGIQWKDIIAAARDVRERLKALKLESFVKTTGGKGLHIVLPIKSVSWDEAKDFCRAFAEQMAADEPKRYTATIKKAARGNRLFVDYLRNSREATAVAPYSTRARPGATVSVPLTWEELGKQKSANAFTVLNLSKRLAKIKKDPWAGMDRVKQALPRLK